AVIIADSKVAFNSAARPGLNWILRLPVSSGASITGRVTKTMQFIAETVGEFSILNNMEKGPLDDAGPAGRTSPAPNNHFQPCWPTTWLPFWELPAPAIALWTPATGAEIAFRQYYQTIYMQTF